MRSPNPKPRSKLARVEIWEAFFMWFISQIQGKVFDKPPEACPKCGSRHLTKDTVRERIFCKLIAPSGDIITIHVKMQLFRCPKNHEIYSDEVFYPGCRYGKPIVDLALKLAADHPFNQVEKLMSEMGIQIDRDTVKRYTQLFGKRGKEKAPIKIMGKTLGINILKLLFDASNVKELDEKHDEVRGGSQADETYLTKKGAKKSFRKENKRRKKEGEDPLPYPDAFAVGLSILPEEDVFASMCIVGENFTGIDGIALGIPLKGSPYTVTDGSNAYSSYENRVRELVHKARNLYAYTVAECTPRGYSDEKILEIFRERYAVMKEKQIEDMKQEYPEFVDADGHFTGKIFGNAMEGANSRVKACVRVPYKVTDSITGKVLLAAIADSIIPFRKGRPVETFGHVNTIFRFENVMGRSPPVVRRFKRRRYYDVDKGRWYVIDDA